MRKYFLILAVVFAFGAGFLLLRRSPAPSTSDAPSATKTSQPKPGKKASGPAALLIGDEQAKLTIVAYGDFQCPRCNRFFHEIEPLIRRDYVDPGKVKIEWRNYATIGTESVAAAQASHCANDQRFFPAFYAAVFNHMEKEYWSKGLNGENVGALTNAKLKQLAGRSYDLINQGEFDKCLDKGKHAKTVQAELDQANSGGFSLNTYVVGKQVIQGVQPYSIFRPVIESQL